MRVGDEIQFEWDEGNFLKLNDAERGVTPALCREIADIEPRFFIETRENRSGDYWMIGPDRTGRFWTIVLVSKGEGLWRPISVGRVPTVRFVTTMKRYENGEEAA
jgi:hypothetical protein